MASKVPMLIALLVCVVEGQKEDFASFLQVPESLCRARCENTSMKEGCVDDCIGQGLSTSVDNFKSQVNLESSSTELKIICQNIHMDQYKQETIDILLSLQNSSLEFKGKLMVYLWEMKSGSSNWTRYRWSKESHIFVKNLHPVTNYQFRLTVMDLYSKIVDQRTSSWFTTFDGTSNVIPSPKKIIVREFVAGFKKLNTRIEWIPPPERFCAYDIHWFSPMSEKLGHQRVSMVNHAQPFQTLITELIYGVNYTISIASMINNGKKSLQTAKTTFKTPGCLISNDFNFTLCGPGKVQSLKYKLNSVPGNMSVDISWKKPNHSTSKNRITGYSLNMRRRVNILLGSKIKIHSKNLELNETNVTIFDLLEDSVYEIKVQALSQGGVGQPRLLIIRTQELISATQKTEKGNFIKEIAIGVGSFLIAAFGIGALVFYMRRKRMSGRTKYSGIADNSYYEKKEAMPPIMMVYPNEKNGYEVDIRRVVKNKVIGEGSFGIVYSGHLVMKSSLRKVAIKTLKDNSREDDQQHLREEIELLRSVGKHPHIVCIVACCSSSQKPCLLMEYCAFGDLRSYLQKAKNNEVIKNDGTYSTGVPCQVSYFDMISYARQVASGMEFLSSNRIVHRDLAARNVLVKSKKIVKITDFGLAKDVYERGLYHMNNEKKLPIKWMAVESIFDQVFTVKSDVWSFGILLWEIMSFGATPYPGIVGVELIPVLRDGYRLTKPADCIDEVYDLMKLCWQIKPSSRPTFTIIRKYLEAIIEATITYLNLESNSCMSPQEEEKNLKRSISLAVINKKSNKSIFDQNGRSLSDVLL